MRGQSVILQRYAQWIRFKKKYLLIMVILLMTSICKQKEKTKE